MRPRLIASLLLHRGLCYKTARFRKPVYIGDPINAIRILNEKGADEIAILDIDATREGRAPQFDLVEDLASEAFMPFAYGGGVSTIEHVKRLTRLGVEKVVLQSAAIRDPDFIAKAAAEVGSQSILIAIDAKRSWGAYKMVHLNGRKAVAGDPVGWARQVEGLGAGEILLTAVDREGSMAGYDLRLVRMVADAVGIPVIASGGAGNLDHVRQALLEGGASAACAGSMFVYQGLHRGVLISYPPEAELDALEASLAPSAR